MLKQIRLFCFADGHMAGRHGAWYPERNCRAGTRREERRGNSEGLWRGRDGKAEPHPNGPTTPGEDSRKSGPECIPGHYEGIAGFFMHALV